MGDVHYIVDKLKAEPFSCSISLLEFRCGARRVARWHRSSVPRLTPAPPRSQREAAA